MLGFACVWAGTAVWEHTLGSPLNSGLASALLAASAPGPVTDGPARP